MRKLLLVFFILIAYSELSAQDSTVVTVKAGYNIEDVLTTAKIYAYPQFSGAHVFFKDGTKAAAPMNYNRLFDQMLFINPNGDTLALADEKTIKFIVIDQDTFYYGEGYMRLIANNDIVKLAEKQVWVFADVRKMGTHNRATGTVSITSLSTYTNGADAAKSKDLILNEDIILRKETQYYFGDKYDHFVGADKKNLLQLFHKDQQRIKTYITENEVDFNKKHDLKKLSAFLGQHN